jgi:hypothetical protein
MAKYIYVGDRAELVSTRFVFTHFGQSIELEKPEVQMLVDAGIHLVPESDFAAVPESELPAGAWKAADAFKQFLKEETTYNNG